MIGHGWLLSPVIVLGFAIGAFSQEAEPMRQPKSGLALWYRQPARQWNAALPVGNGRIGAMVFGDPAKERIALNECTFWSGRPHDYNDPQAGH